MNMNWFKAAGVRAVKTMCQTGIAIAATGTILQDVDWTLLVSAMLLAGFLSILTSLAGLPELDEKTGAPVGDETPTKTTEDTQAVAAEKAVAAEEDKEAEDAAAEKGAE